MNLKHWKSDPETSPCSCLFIFYRVIVVVGAVKTRRGHQCVCVCVCVCAAFPPRKTTPVEHDLLISVFLVVAYVHKMFYRRLYKQMHPTQEAFWLRHHGVGEVP